MNSSFSSLKSGVSLCGIVMHCSLLSLQAQQPIPVTPSRAIQLSIPSVPGNTYRLYSSTDLAHWSPVANSREFGTGATLSSIEPAPEAGKFFRYLVEGQPSGGLAPWSVAGQEWEANSSGNFTAYRFFSPTNGSVQVPGQAAPALVTYELVRTGENSLKLTLSFSANRTRTIDCTYLTTTSGTLTSQDTTNGIVVDSAHAIFQPLPPPSELLPSAPQGLNGRFILLQEPTGPTLAAFADGKKLPALPGNTPFVLGEGYHAEGDTATFTIRDEQRVDFYHLQFNSLRGGIFFRKRTTPGLPSAAQNGTFLLPAGL